MDEAVVADAFEDDLVRSAPFDPVAEVIVGV